MPTCPRCTELQEEVKRLEEEIKGKDYALNVTINIANELRQEIARLKRSQRRYEINEGCFSAKGEERHPQASKSERKD